MKQLILTIALTLFFAATNAQDTKTYKVHRAEWYLYEGGEWKLQTQNNDVSIDMVFYKDAINIQAKTPTLFKLKDTKKKSIDGKGYYGYEFEALECVNGRKCDVDYIYLKDDKTAFILSIFFTEDGRYVNMRYYSTLND